MANMYNAAANLGMMQQQQQRLNAAGGVVDPNQQQMGGGGCGGSDPFFASNASAAALCLAIAGQGMAAGRGGMNGMGGASADAPQAGMVGGQQQQQAMPNLRGMQNMQMNTLSATALTPTGYDQTYGMAAPGALGGTAMGAGGLNPADVKASGPPANTGALGVFSSQQVVPGAGGGEGYPTCNVDYPGPNDVMCGRGGGTNNHVGNIRFRRLVNGHKLRYLAASKTEKPMIAREVVQIWRSLNPPGRFLAQDKSSGDNGMWHDVGDKKAREKASQCLRERTPDVIPFVRQLEKQAKGTERAEKLRKEGKDPSKANKDGAGSNKSSDDGRKSDGSDNKDGDKKDLDKGDTMERRQMPRRSPTSSPPFSAPAAASMMAVSNLMRPTPPTCPHRPIGMLNPQIRSFRKQFEKTVHSAKKTYAKI